MVADAWVFDQCAAIQRVMDAVKLLAKKIHIVAVNGVKGKMSILRERWTKVVLVVAGAQYLDVSISVTHAEMASKNKASCSSSFHHPFLFRRC